MTIQIATLAVAPASELAWYCIRSQAKREHIAGTHLSRFCKVEVFNPRIRRRQRTRRGMVWMVESLFPSYLFARFHLQSMLHQVIHTPGVNDVVHFGTNYSPVPEAILLDLKREFPEDNLTIQQEEIVPGTAVTLLNNPFRGLQGVVLRTLPAKDRVQVLMEMLGRACKLEVDLQSLSIEKGTHPGEPLRVLVPESETRPA